jgi:outer membrane lipoprotein-sorting protein
MTGSTKISSIPRSAPKGILPAVFLLLVLLSSVGAGPGIDSSREFLNTWMDQQAKINTWSADVVQTRNLKSLVRPLKSRGQVWFLQPNRFRWQLGDPPRTIAVRKNDELLIIYPRLKQIERFAGGEDVDPAWKQVLALLEVGFPSDSETFFSRYELVRTTRLKKSWKFELRPAAEAARKLLDRVTVEISTRDFTLLATELIFPDGSTMKNEFIRHRLNPDLDERLFDFEIEGDYTVVNPLQKDGQGRSED